MEFMPLTPQQLIDAGVHEGTDELCQSLNQLLSTHSSAEEIWHQLSKTVLSAYPFSVHLYLFNSLFPKWHQAPETAPAWLPDEKTLQHSNIQHWLTLKNFTTVSQLQQWAHQHFTDFWRDSIQQLGIIFKKPYQQICDLQNGLESPRWLAGAQMNIIDSCFTAAAEQVAIIYSDETNQLHQLTYRALDRLSNQIANGLVQAGFQVGDAIAIAMPMNHLAVAAYLGIIKMGGVVVSIADSFSANEMATRFQISHTKLVFTQDIIPWENKNIPLYEKVKNAFADKVVVYPSLGQNFPVRPQDITWEKFLSPSDHFTSVACDPMAACNILFSSGTTGEPKAIVWNHTTAIKAASDAFFHQDIHQKDILAWPTNLGWMMGPWLVFASLINQATMALHHSAPKNRAYGEFIQNARVTMLGVVPTLVASWRQSGCMEKLDWQQIKCFASTGECSNSEDMLYLMSLAHYKPVIEYCGGTEIGGAYLTSTMVQKNYPSLFSTPAMGLDFVLLDEEGHPASLGEVALIPPSMGLSTTLLNADHHHVYFENMPKTATGITLRRHGDLIQQLSNHYYCILGRIDDTMNLSGIKVSAAEIERSLAGVPGIFEVAAIAISPVNNGPNELVIYAAIGPETFDKKSIIKAFQTRINKQLNPYFKIHDVVFVKELPKTASNKIMRRTLRKQYTSIDPTSSLQ